MKGKSLDTQTKSLLVDRADRPWSGNMGEIRLRHLLSFTAGISSDSKASEDKKITLEEAVLWIYDDQSPTASPPGSSFFYGGVTQMRIAARLAERATGLSWRELYDKYFRLPFGWSAESTYGGASNPSNPSPGIGLVCTGREYTRFLMMQLRSGMDGRPVSSTRAADSVTFPKLARIRTPSPPRPTTKPRSAMPTVQPGRKRGRRTQNDETHSPHHPAVRAAGRAR